MNRIPFGGSMCAALAALTGLLLAQEPGRIELHEFPLKFPYEIVGRDSPPSVADMAGILSQEKIAPVLIFRISEKDADYYAPKFSADGKSLAYLKADIERRTSKIVLAHDVAKPERTILLNKWDCYDYMFDWSYPDPAAYVFSSTGTRDELNVYLGRPGVEPLPLTLGASLKKHGDLFLSGGSVRLLYEDGRSLKMLEMKSLDAGAAGPAKDIGYGGYPAWGPDGRSIAFVRERGEAGGRPVYDLALQWIGDGAESRSVRTLFSESGMAVRNPVWDATGTSVAFYVGEMKRKWDLYVVRARGQSPGRMIAEDVVTNEVFTSVDAVWDPSGKGLFYFTNKHEQAGYYPLCFTEVNTGRESVIHYDKSLSVAMDVAAGGKAQEPEVAFAASHGMSRSIYIMILNHL